MENIQKSGDMCSYMLNEECFLSKLKEMSAESDFNMGSYVQNLAAEKPELASFISETIDNENNILHYELMKYKLAGQAQGIAHWDIEIIDGDPTNGANVFECSEELASILQIENREDIPVSFSQWLEFLYPNDREYALEAYYAYAYGKADTFDINIRLKLKNGKIIWVNAFGAAVRRFDGMPVRIAGATKDIDKEHKMKKRIARHDGKLRTQAHWYKSILDAIPLPVSVTDTDEKLTFVNAYATDLFGRDREELLGEKCSVWGVPICGTEDCSIARAKRGEMQTFFQHENNSYQVSTDIIKDLDGKSVGYVEILQDVTEIEKLARQQADFANEAKSKFLANISHEMRTPLNAILGMSEILLGHGELTQNCQEYLDRIHDAGSTLLSIVNDILDISKMEAGKFEICEKEYDVAGVLSDSINQNILRINSRPIRFNVNVPHYMPTHLLGDEIRIKQIANNLLSNAFKYTERGVVDLNVDFEKVDDVVWIILKISDTGIGITESNLKQMFSDYTRFDEEFNRKTDGTGLGLSITKRLIDLMHGTIDVESEVGKGSIFTVRLPQGYINNDVIGFEIAENLRHHRYSTKVRKNRINLEYKKIPYGRVLIVDDNITNLEIARGLLEPYELSIDCVTTGMEAVELIREAKVKYHAIFMDHMMPEMDGIEAAQIIRTEIDTEYARTVPIIALTANAIIGGEDEFLNNGFNDFISKPIDIYKLDKAILHWVRDKEQEDLPEDSGEQLRPGSADGVTGMSDVSGGCAQKPEGLDWDDRLKYFGSEETYKKILNSYAVNMEALLESISDINTVKLERYTIVVHGIKSSSYSVGANKVGELAEALEFAAKSDDMNFISLNHQKFMDSANKLIADIKAFFESENLSVKREKKVKVESSNLTQLFHACKNYDMDAIDDVMSDIERYEYTADGDLIHWLRNNIAQLNYKNIIKKIAPLIMEA